MKIYVVPFATYNRSPLYYTCYYPSYTLDLYISEEVIEIEKEKWKQFCKILKNNYIEFRRNDLMNFLTSDLIFKNTFTIKPKSDFIKIIPPDCRTIKLSKYIDYTIKAEANTWNNFKDEAYSLKFPITISID